MYLLSIRLFSVSLASSSSSAHLLKTYVSKNRKTKQNKKKPNVSKDGTLGLHVHREQLYHGEHAGFPSRSEGDDPQMCLSFISFSLVLL